MKKSFPLLILIANLLTMSGCEAIGAIFKAGFWGGVTLVVLVVFLIILIFFRHKKK